MSLTPPSSDDDVAADGTDDAPGAEPDDELLGDSPFAVRDAVLATVGAILLGAVFGGIIVGVAGYERFTDAPIPVLLLAQVPLWAGLVGIPWLIVRRRGSGSLVRDLRLRMHWTDVPVGLGAGVLTQILVLLFVPLYRALGIDPDDIGESAQLLADKADDPLSVVLLVVMAVAGAAIAEEICYRGLWIRALGRLGGPVAVGVSSLVFAAAHFDPLTFPPLFVFGVVAGALAVSSGRLGPAIWAHVGFNALAIVALVAG